MDDRVNLVRTAIRNLLTNEDGISIESEATVFIRSLEGGVVAAGLLEYGGGIKEEIEFDLDIEAAINFFLSKRKELNHG